MTDDDFERGEAVTPTEVDGERPPSQPAADAAPEGDDAELAESQGGGTGAGYDTDAVSGDTEIYRPD
jgi:hypothetical protein